MLAPPQALSQDERCKVKFKLYYLHFMFRVDENSMIRNQYNRIPHPAPDTKRGKHKNKTA